MGGRENDRKERGVVLLYQLPILPRTSLVPKNPKLSSTVRLLLARKILGSGDLAGLLDCIKTGGRLVHLASTSIGNQRAGRQNCSEEKFAGESGVFTTDMQGGTKGIARREEQ